jgi:c-di-GMP-binding flagellar brake protein YcgR
MHKKKDVPLKIELFSDGEDSNFCVHSKREIQSILHRIAQDGSRAALYYDEGNDFILTSVLDVNAQGLWLDIGSIAASNQRILRSDKIIFISSHNQVKVQFVAHRIENASFENGAAFYMPLPDSLLRIQRREYFRLTTPSSKSLRCIIPSTPRIIHQATPSTPDAPISKREVTIMDISGGGVALVCEAHDAELQPGKIYPDCQISLPEVGTITATIKVKNTFMVTLRNGQVSKRAGCEFLHLNSESTSLLQRYVTRLQREILSKQ